MRKKSPLKYLVIAPAWVGDMVMAQTLFKLIKQRDPAAEIDVVAPKVTRPLVARMPEVKGSYLLPVGHGELRIKERWRLGRSLRCQHYDQVFILPNSFKAAIVPWAARVRTRTGWLREGRWLLLNDSRQLNKDKLPLMIQRFMALGLPLNEKLPTETEQLWPALATDTDNTEALLQRLQLNTGSPILALCPGAEYGEAKRWLPEYFAAVAKAKIVEGWQVWLMGSAKDVPIAAAIQQHANQQCIDLTGKTSLADAVDLMALASAVVSNDSGLMHIAAALQRPLVVIYGSSSSRFTPPLKKHVKIASLNLDCSPCFQRTCPLGHFNCMRELKPTTVLGALAEIR